MTTFFRAQAKGITFEEMQSYDSIHSDDDDFEARPGGLAACMSASGHEGGSQFGGAPLDDEAEIVVFKGRTIAQIYDGWLVDPIQEIARFPATAWLEMIENGEAFEYECW